ncbi:MAG: biotin--[acetyl-CoA-carboxylase] ligase [Ruminococcaceae bacterium]|nr:biotin--[acetyl-CoA-carboxylase] ligase [Oscillospiraceae bacterium]
MVDATQLSGGLKAFTPQAIQSHLLLPSTPVQVYDVVDSTNLVAKNWAAKGAPHGALVVARRQDAGRGRMGRGFSSPPGGIYMSVVLRCPPEMAQKPGLVTSAAAVATCRAVSRLCGMELHIKWVNDLYYNGGKCCGILAEGGVLADGSQYLVVGIGLNYTTPTDAFSPAAAAVATVLFPGGDAPLGHAQLAAAIHDALMEIIDMLPAHGFLEEYRFRSMVLGRTVTVLSTPPYTAQAIEIDDEARLIIQLPDGKRQVLSWGEISVRVKDD